MLLTWHMLAAIQALIMKRELAGVQSDFLFARPGVAATEGMIVFEGMLRNVVQIAQNL